LLIGDSGETDGKVALESDESLLMLAADGDTYGTITTSSSTVSVLPNTFGEQRVAVLLVNFQDKPDDKPFTPTQAHNFVFGTINDFYWENSYGQTWLTGDVFGWLTMTIDTSNCHTIRPYADAVAKENGVDLSLYSRIIYFIAPSNCGGNSATVGGSPSRAYIRSGLNLRVTAHELGHNFGLLHSHGLNCEGGVLASNCVEIEYGDLIDIMGWREVHLNPFQKEWLGWLDYNQSPPITEVTTDGIYTISPMETDDGQPNALRILHSIDPQTGKKTWYYLEYRQPIGFDEILFDPANFINYPENLANGVVIRLGTEADRNSSFLLDMTPDSINTTSSSDLRDPALVVGESYTDDAAGLTMTPLWTDSAGAAVNVSFETETCIQANPSLDLSPTESQWVEPGTPVSYTVTVTNKNSAVCPVSEYYIEATPPSEWNAALAGPTLILEPGASASTTLTVTSPVWAEDGFYSIEVTGSNMADLSYNTSGSLTYVVSSGSVNEAPIAVDDSAVTYVDTPVIIAVLANDFDPDGDALQVTSTTQGANGGVVINADNTVTYTPANGFTGNDGFTYTISDGNGRTDRANVFIRVETPLLTISGLSPNSVKRGGKVNTILSGSGFAQGIKVQFQNGEGPAPTVNGVTMMDAETLSVSISTKSGGPARNLYWDVVVTNPDGKSAQLEDGFVVTP
jgi:hypothetical protein